MAHPVAGLFDDGPDGPRLTGSRCPRCAATFFPRSAVCRRCGATPTEPTALATTGRIETYTSVGDVGVADIRLDDGVLVLGRAEPKDLLAVGAAVRFAPLDEIVRFEVA